MANLSRSVRVGSTWKMGNFNLVFGLGWLVCSGLTDRDKSFWAHTRPFRPGYNRTGFQPYQNEWPVTGINRLFSENFRGK
jgi:hypothetical protein